MPKQRRVVRARTPRPPRIVPVEIKLMRLGRERERFLYAGDVYWAQFLDELIRYWIGATDPTGERNRELHTLVLRGRNIVRRAHHDSLVAL